MKHFFTIALLWIGIQPAFCTSIVDNSNVTLHVRTYNDYDIALAIPYKIYTIAPNTTKDVKSGTKKHKITIDYAYSNQIIAIGNPAALYADTDIIAVRRGDDGRVRIVTAEPQVIVVEPLPNRLPAASPNDQLTEGQGLRLGGILYSTQATGKLKLQKNGNLVALRNDKVIWSSNTANKGAKYLILLKGRLFLYTDTYRIIWEGGGNRVPAYIKMGNEGIVWMNRKNTKNDHLWRVPVTDPF